MTMACLSLSIPKEFLKDKNKNSDGMTELHVTTAWKATAMVLGYHYPKPYMPVEDNIQAKDKQNNSSFAKSYSKAIIPVNL
jgi:hypothetical protein